MMNKEQQKLFNDAECLFIDMDGTLVETDMANNAAYEKAVNIVTGKNLQKYSGRITSDIIYNKFPSMVATEIVDAKNCLFSDFLNLTKVNSDLINIIMKSGKKCFVVSHCNPKRGEATLKYHNLYSLMDACLFFDKNKFNLGLQQLHINPNSVFVFDNEMRQKQNAINAGIQASNIYLV